MGATEVAAIPFGQHLGQTARAGNALMLRTLAANSATFEGWVVLNLLATRGHAIPRHALERELAAALQSDMEAASGLVDRLESAGLLHAPGPTGERGAHDMALTEAGGAEYRRLRDAVDRLASQLQDGVDPDDLQATIRVLTRMKERADALLAP